MRINIEDRIIEYFWDDEKKRELSAESVSAIRNEVAQNRLSGRLTQNDGEPHLCGWRDVNGDDTFLWSFMNTWFNQ
jgi:hypothetical protein